MADVLVNSTMLHPLSVDMVTSMSSVLWDNISSTTTTMPEKAAPVAPPDNAETLQVVRYVVQKVCVPVVVGLGVIGNILNMVVLTRRSMTNSTNCYLTALAAFDTLYLIFSLALSFKHHDGFDRTAVYVHWFVYGRVLTDMAANVSVLLTVTFTVERYIGVCHPMKGRVLCTPQRARIVIALVVFIAVACTVPELFEMEVVWKRDEEMNETYAAWQYTDFSSSYSYQIGYYWFFVTVFTFLPLVLLCIFNGILIASLFKAAKLRSRMTNASPSRQSERHSREQQWITKMLVTVVLVFILCQLPGAVLLLTWSYNELAQVQVTPAGRNRLLIAGNITNLLVQINASTNFILYSMTSSKFRRVFCRTLCVAAKTTTASSFFYSGGRGSGTFKNGAIPLASFTTVHRHENDRCQRSGSHDSVTGNRGEGGSGGGGGDGGGGGGGGGGGRGGGKKTPLRLMIKRKIPLSVRRGRGSRSGRGSGGSGGGGGGGHRGSRGSRNGSWMNPAEAWNRTSDAETISPTTEVCYTDSDRDF